MPKPACPKCQRFYRPKKNGYAFIEAMPVGGVRAPPGTEAPEMWKPYKLWVGDLWACEGCESEIIIGALHPVAEHYQTEFAAQVARLQPETTINDC